MTLRKIAELHPHPILRRFGLDLEEVRRCRQAVEGSPKIEPLEAKFRRMRAACRAMQEHPSRWMDYVGG